MWLLSYHNFFIDEQNRVQESTEPSRCIVSKSDAFKLKLQRMK